MKRFLTTGNNLFRSRVLSRTTASLASIGEAKSLRTDRRQGHKLTVEDKISILVDGQSLRIFEDRLHIPHSEFENTLDSVIDTKINSWRSELNSIKSLWEKNKASEAIKKCEALIHQIESFPVFSTTQAGYILCDAYIFKGDFLRLTGAFEKHAKEAFACYSKVLKIMPDNQAAKDGVENLRIIRGESTKTKVEEPDPETSPFRFS